MMQARKQLTIVNFQNLLLRGINNRYLAKNSILNSILVSIFVFGFLIFMKLGTNLYGLTTVTTNFVEGDFKYSLYEENGTCTAKLTGFSASSNDWMTKDWMKVVVPASVRYDNKNYEVREVGKDACSFCEALKSVDLSECVNLKSIDNDAFYGCVNLESIKIPKGVNFIGECMCGHCTRLSKIEIGENDKYIVVDNVVYELDSENHTAKLIIFPGGHQTNGAATKSFRVPGTVKKDGVEYKVTGIGNKAFFGCIYLEGVNLSGCKYLESICNDAFFCCKALKSLDFSNCVNLQSIGNYVFGLCGALKSLDFSGCVNLQSIGDYAFPFCGALKSLDFSGCVNLKSIGVYAFKGCNSLEFIIFTKEPTSVGENAFSYNGGTYTYHKVTFKDKDDSVVMVQYVFIDTGNGAKNGYAKKPSDPTKDDCKFVGWYDETENLFNFDTKITGNKTLTASYEETVEERFVIVAENFVVDNLKYCLYKENGVCTAILKGFSDSATDEDKKEVVVPASVRYGNKYYEVREVGDKAFFKQDLLKSVTFADDSKIERIANRAFMGCSDLEFVDFSNCVNLQSIGNYVFGLCGALKSLDFSGCVNLQSIGNYVFWNCKALEGVDFSNCVNLESIGDYTFYGCSALKSVNLSGCINLKSVGNYVFGLCEALKSVNLSGCINLKSVGNYVFGLCKALTNVDFSKCVNLESIGDCAFYGCGDLECVDLSGCINLKSIGDYVFFGCNSVQFIVYNP